MNSPRRPGPAHNTETLEEGMDRLLKEHGVNGVTSSLLAFTIAQNPRAAVREDRLAALFNAAGCKPRCYIGEGREHGYIQMPQAELARAVYKAARNGGFNVVKSAKMWRKVRFA